MVLVYLPKELEGSNDKLKLIPYLKRKKTSLNVNLISGESIQSLRDPVDK